MWLYSLVVLNKDLCPFILASQHSELKMVGKLAVGYLYSLWILWKERNWCETCNNLVHIALTIGELHHTEYLAFLDTFKYTIRPVLPH